MNGASYRWIPVALAACLALAGTEALPGGDEIVERFEGAAGGTLPAGWAAEQGKWLVENDGLVAEAEEGEARVRIGERRWQDLALEVAVRLERWEAGDGVAVDFARAGAGEPAFHSVIVRGAAGGLEVAHAVVSADGAVRGRVGGRAAAPAAGTALRLRVAVGGGRVRVHVDGKHSLESALALDAREGTVALRAFGARASFDDLRLAEPGEEERARLRVASDRRLSLVVVAHRGASSIAPENTLASLRLGAAIGAEACEFDVYRTKDGEIVLLHDHDVLRTTDFKQVFSERPAEAARVEALTRDDLARLDAGSWKSPAYRGEKVPTLRQALDLLKGRAVAVVEIKADDIGRDVARVVREAGAEDGVYVFSFSARAIEDFRAELPEVPTGLLFEAGGPPEGAHRALEHVRLARRAGASAVACHYSSITPEYLAEAHRRAMAVWVYTVDEPAVMVMLREMGLDGLVTNFPDVALRIRAQASPEEVAAGSSPAGGGAEFEARPGRKGLKVRLEHGEYPILEIARLVSDAAGLPLLVDGADRAVLGEKIVVPGTIAEADGEIAKALLEASGFRLYERHLAGGERVLILETAAADARPQEPKDQPIIVVGGRTESTARGADARGARRSVAKGPEKETARLAGLILGPVPEIVRAQTELHRGEGVLIEDLDEKSLRGRPDLAPLRLYDIVTHVGDHAVGSAGDFVKELNALEPGEKFLYRLLRGGARLIVPARK